MAKVRHPSGSTQGGRFAPLQRASTLPARKLSLKKMPYDALENSLRSKMTTSYNKFNAECEAFDNIDRFPRCNSVSVDLHNSWQAMQRTQETWLADLDEYVKYISNKYKITDKEATDRAFSFVVEPAAA